MTPAFITLPSGLRVNTAHIIHYGQSEHDGQIKIILTDEPTPWLETMALFEMDALLQPQGTPIVSPIIDLDKLKPGSACQFSRDGKTRMGVFNRIGKLRYSDQHEGTPYFEVISDGETYQISLQ